MLMTHALSVTERTGGEKVLVSSSCCIGGGCTSWEAVAVMGDVLVQVPLEEMEFVRRRFVRATSRESRTSRVNDTRASSEIQFVVVSVVGGAAERHSREGVAKQGGRWVLEHITIIAFQY